MSAPTGSSTSLGSRSAGEAAGTLVVSEVFGPTFQGEGPSIGRRCAFVRLGGCNLHCAWCDTPYTWDWTGRNGHRYDPRQELTRRSVEDVWEELDRKSVQMLVVSGGEPLLQQDALTGLLQRAAGACWWIEVETAGTIVPAPGVAALVSQFNVSPKLSNSGNRVRSRYVPAALDALRETGKAAWKFVATAPEDLDEIDGLVDEHQLCPVYVMPEGTQAGVVNTRAQELAEGVLARGWNLTTRLQVLLYGNRRGV